MKTFSAKPLEVKREWYVVDATDKVVGRLAAEIALIVVNADKLVMTGAKAEDKKYFRHSGYPGGVYETTFRKMQEKHPGRALEIAVKGMLPKGPLGYAMFKKLFVYAGSDHKHSAQQPKQLEI